MRAITAILQTTSSVINRGNYRRDLFSEGCKALTTIVVNKKTGTTSTGMAAFRQQRPDCEVVVK